jgi:alpha-methylacyl-CoA racemase
MPITSPPSHRSGPLAGLRVVEFAGIGPGPFAGMLLADMGADVVRIDRPGTSDRPIDVSLRGKRIIRLDLKQQADLESALQLLDGAAALIEGFRPGVMERLGLGPDVVLARNPALVYGRMTGWGQSGPLAEYAGHDITYIAITGALAAIGPRDGKPTPPLNLVGDFGGGSLYLVMGVLAAILQARSSGQGQVVDCAISDCVVNLMSMFHGMLASGRWTTERGANLLDGGAHFYTTYECADGKHLAVGALEPQFYAKLRELAGLDDPAFDEPRRQADWPAMQHRLATIFRTRTRDAWCALLEHSDACVAPVLTLHEAPSHPHHAARGAFITQNGITQSAPAPRFSATPSAAGPHPTHSEAAAIVAEWQAAAKVGTV